jgi:hypothetical protein
MLVTKIEWRRYLLLENCSTLEILIILPYFSAIFHFRVSACGCVDGQVEGGTRNAKGDKLPTMHLRRRLGARHRVGGRPLRGLAQHLYAAAIRND